MTAFLRVLTMAVCASAFSAPVELEVRGRPFEIGELRDGAKAFANRDYVWEHVPKELAGWQCTRLHGGVPATLTGTAAAAGEAYIATPPGAVPLPGWKLLPQWRFNYTDASRSQLRVYSRSCAAGEVFEVPQGGWVGGILLAPKLTGRQDELKLDTSHVPGVVIAHSPAYTGDYIGCPSIVILPDGEYGASHSFFGNGARRGSTRVYRSAHRGRTWEMLAELANQQWSNLFWHRGALYLMGVRNQPSGAAIRRSEDRGKTWTTPVDEKTGLLIPGPYHTAPCPVVVHQGRIWRAMEESVPGGRWPAQFKAFMLSAPEDADLLSAASWTASTRVPGGVGWNEREYKGWLEGNAVVDPAGAVVNVLRVDSYVGDVAAIVRISEDGKTASFDPKNDFVQFPGGAVKFTIRFDPASHLYWALTCVVDEDTRAGRTAGSVRNTLALVCSADLRTWQVRRTILHHPDPLFHAFQYVDWQFDGEDIVAVSRTAFDDGMGGAHNFHDANFLTFHRVEGFRP